jgi:hypothetical protein
MTPQSVERPISMTDDELIETVAKAMYDATHHNMQSCYSWDDAWEDHQEHHRQRYYREARAAIEATRIEQLRKALEAAEGTMSAAMVMMGARNDSLTEAQRQGNINQAWHRLKNGREGIDAALIQSGE